MEKLKGYKMQDYVMFGLELLVFIILGLVGIVFKMVFNLIKDGQTKQIKLDKTLSNHKLHAAETFATKIDVDKGFDRVMDKLDTMDEKTDTTMLALNHKIDQKADK